MKKTVCILISVLISASMFSACANGTNSVSTKNSSSTEYSIVQKSKSDESNISESPPVSEEHSYSPKEESSKNTPLQSSNESSQIESESSKVESNSKIDNTKYPRPEIDNSKIIMEIPFSSFDSKELVNENSIEFIMKYFNEKIYENGQIIDVKNDLSSFENSEKYYSICANMYYTLNHFSINQPFEEVSVTLDEYCINYVIDEKNDLILKSKEDIKLNIYLKDNRAFFLISKV